MKRMVIIFILVMKIALLCCTAGCIIIVLYYFGPNVRTVTSLISTTIVSMSYESNCCTNVVEPVINSFQFLSTGSY